MANVSSTELVDALGQVFEHARQLFQQKPEDALPDPAAVKQAVAELMPALPDEGRGMSVGAVSEHLMRLTKGFSGSSLSSTYYGFVTGGVTPYALVADVLASVYDQNAQVHLPEQSCVMNVEDRGLTMLLDLLDLDAATVWRGRTLTTGATAGNIQGLACGREWILQARLDDNGGGGSVGELGLLEACRRAGVHEIKVLSTRPHSSLSKAASVVGLGRDSCIEVRRKDAVAQSLLFDLHRLEEELKVEGRACIVAISCGEVNTGNFATYSREEVQSIRSLCDKYKAWLHVDGAFGIFARLLAKSGREYDVVSRGAAGMELADSIAGDLHKFLNVPYDCGFFASHMPEIQTSVYQNANASYLSFAQDGIASALNLGAENSRRFRGFAVYSTLVGLGRAGYTSIMKAQVDLSRKIAKVIDDTPQYDLLNGNWHEDCKKENGKDYLDIFSIVIFSAKSDSLNKKLAEVINSQRSIFVSGTSWDGRPACRIAVSNWQVNPDKDLETVRTVLEYAATVE